MLPQAKERQKLEHLEQILSHLLQYEHDLLTPQFWASDIYNYKAIDLCCSKAIQCVTLYLYSSSKLMQTPRACVGQLATCHLYPLHSGHSLLPKTMPVPEPRPPHLSCELLQRLWSPGMQTTSIKPRGHHHALMLQRCQLRLAALLKVSHDLSFTTAKSLNPPAYLSGL